MHLKCYTELVQTITIIDAKVRGVSWAIQKMFAIDGKDIIRALTTEIPSQMEIVFTMHIAQWKNIYTHMRMYSKTQKKKKIKKVFSHKYNCSR